MKDKIKQIVLESLDELNEQLDEDEKVQVSEDIRILGSGGQLDSLDFVNLTCIIEDRIFEELNKSITIVNEKAFSKKHSPFQNVITLSEFIQELIEGEE